MGKMSKVRLSLLSTLLFALIISWIILPDYFYNKGLDCYKKGKYVCAYKNLANAMIWNKQNSDYRYYYVQTLAKFKPTLKIQKEMFSYANDTNNDSAHIFAGIQVNLWRNNAIQTYGDNYIEQAPIDSSIIRWNPKTFPLKVYVDYVSNTKYPEYYSGQITKAFTQWALASGFISFNFINNPDTADIVVKFESLPENNCKENGCKYVVAHTDPIIKRNILKQMVITLYDKTASNSFFSDRELYNTVLHEIGHALGIMGHSYSTDDLMYMETDNENLTNRLFIQYRSDFQYISRKDISTLKLLYNIVPNISNTPISEINTTNMLYPPIILGNMKVMSARKLAEAKNYVEKAPNLPGGYIDMGIAYDELGDFDNALAAFQKAFNFATTNNDKYIVLYNMATMYLNNNKPETALEYAKQAQAISNTEEVADLIGNIEHAMTTKQKPFWASKISK